MRLLVVFPAWIGDAVMAQSLLKQLKKTAPQSHISVLTPQSIAPLVALMPQADSILETDFGHGGLQLKARWHLGQKLSKQFDHAIVLPNSFKSALIPWLAKIPKRTGWHGESRFIVLNDRRRGRQRFERMVDRYQILATPAKQPLPKLHLQAPELVLDIQTRQSILTKYPVTTQKPIIALCPGAAYGPSKRWPAASFARLADYCLQQNWQVWVFGGQAERQLALNIQHDLHNPAHADFHSFAGQCQLKDSIYLLSLASQVVSNDSGLMHITAALSRPLICIYGGSSPTYTPPLTDDKTILSTELACQPCFKRKCRFNHYHCLQEITPEDVFKVLHARHLQNELQTQEISTRFVS